MKLTEEQEAILNGSEGETTAKIMRTLVEFGDIFGAKRLAPVSTNEHLVTSFGIGLLTDEGRKADWVVEIKTSSLPEAQILISRQAHI